MDNKIAEFLAFTGADGESNREKTIKRQHIIRRIATTDKSKSYEDSDQSKGEGEYPAGVVVEDGSSLRILGLQDNAIDCLDVTDLTSCQGIDAGMNRLASLDVSRCRELAELYINDNRFTEIELSACSKLKYFYCHNNDITELDTRNNPLLRHLNATGNPMKKILSPTM